MAGKAGRRSWVVAAWLRSFVVTNNPSHYLYPVQCPVQATTDNKYLNYDIQAQPGVTRDEAVNHHTIHLCPLEAWKSPWAFEFLFEDFFL